MSVCESGILSLVPPLDSLVKLAAKRVVLGVDVAAAKFVAGQRIHDPAREGEILGRVASRLNGAGTGQEIWVAFFRDQMEASKVIQRGLRDRWLEYPWELPLSLRNLAAEIRPELDVINEDMLSLLANIEGMPPVPYGHLKDLFDSGLRTSPPLSRLSKLRQEAADVALRSLASASRH
jgi:chorismate mutase